MTLHAFNYIDTTTSNDTNLLKNEVILKKVVSDVVFFMLNVPSIYTFSKQYITLLNNNLLYYEDKITNDIVFFTIGLLALLFIIILY